MKILFANIGWMEHYKGICDADMIVGGGSYDDMGKCEVFNFQDYEGICYGYVQTVHFSNINLSRIDVTVSRSASKINNVLVVWIASRPDGGGSCIVGWYNNATVYTSYQNAGDIPRNGYHYNIIAKKEDCVLLPVDSRTFNVPRAATTEKGFLGQSNVWYADYESISVKKFRENVLEFIKNYRVHQNTIVKSLIKVDTEARNKVEETAIEYVTNEYRKKGYSIISRESENVGWDLDATCDKINLKLEVKGLASNTLCVHISANEYEKMSEDRKNYRLCVVLNAISNPQLVVFMWDNTLEQWVSEDDPSIVLDIDMKPSYMASVK